MNKSQNIANIQKVVYEQIPEYCKHCQRRGHTTYNCNFMKTINKMEKQGNEGKNMEKDNQSQKIRTGSKDRKENTKSWVTRVFYSKLRKPIWSIKKYNKDNTENSKEGSIAGALNSSEKIGSELPITSIYTAQNKAGLEDFKEKEYSSKEMLYLKRGEQQEKQEIPLMQNKEMEKLKPANETIENENNIIESEENVQEIEVISSLQGRDKEMGVHLVLVDEENGNTNPARSETASNEKDRAEIEEQEQEVEISSTQDTYKINKDMMEGDQGKCNKKEINRSASSKTMEDIEDHRLEKWEENLNMTDDERTERSKSPKGDGNENILNQNVNAGIEAQKIRLIQNMQQESTIKRSLRLSEKAAQRDKNKIINA